MTTKLKRSVQQLISHSRDDVDAAVKAMGCPYPALDPRTLPWIEGYKAGLAFMEEAIRP